VPLVTDHTPHRTDRALPRRPAWAGRNYTLLTAAAVVTNLGAQGALIAAAFAVLGAGGDATDVGLVAAARLVPMVVFILIGGAIADRLPRHRVMVAANTLSFFSQGTFAVLVLAGEPRLWQMMLLSALGGTGHAFFLPASEGMLLTSVHGEHAARAFAVYRVGVHTATIGGVALGGALTAVVGPGWVLALDACAFAVAASLRAFLDVRDQPPREATDGLLADLRIGWHEVVSRPWLWSIVLQFSVVNAMVGTADAVFGPVVAERSLGGAGPWGLALAVYAAGTVLGGLLMTRWKPRRLLFVGTFGIFPMALPTAGLAVPVSVPVLCLLMLVAGVCVEVFGVAWMTAMHQEIPEDRLSRVSSYDWFGSIGMMPVAAALAGPAEKAFGLSATLWGCSAAIVLLTAAVLLVPDVRNMTRRRAEPVRGVGAVGAETDADAGSPAVG
jgi:MFS family permease